MEPLGLLECSKQSPRLFCRPEMTVVFELCDLSFESRYLLLAFANMPFGLTQFIFVSCHCG